jgi:low temperature requirement protein LtrA
MTGPFRRATMRDHSVPERPATPLELLFDLCFVVAVAFLAAELHHGVAAHHTAPALTAYLLLFVPIWWAWMSYTWYATAFSHDDAVTRVLTGAQMLGVLAVAAAIPAATRGELVPFAVAYAVMRLPLVAQWLRSAHADRRHRGFALTYALGSVLAQVLWVAGALSPGPARVALFVLALAVELVTPVLAVRRSPDRVFHPAHVAERYGLFTIIVLGESILAVSVGLREVIDASALVPAVLVAVVATLVVTFATWWLYFDTLGAQALVRGRRAAFAWGYGHYLVFAATAAIGAGVQAGLDSITGVEDAGGTGGARLVAASVAVVMLTVLALARISRPVPPTPLAAGAVLAGGLAAVAPVLGTAATLAAVAVVTAVAAGAQTAAVARQAEPNA